MIYAVATNSNLRELQVLTAIGTEFGKGGCVPPNLMDRRQRRRPIRSLAPTATRPNIAPSFPGQFTARQGETIP